MDSRGINFAFLMLAQHITYAWYFIVKQYHIIFYPFIISTLWGKHTPSCLYAYFYLQTS